MSASSGRSVFYKYMSASTAKIVLRTRSLRWSSPLIFNDPFDFPRELAFGLSPGELQLAAGKAFAELLQSPPSDVSDLAPMLGFLANAAKDATPELRKEMYDGAIDEAQKQASKRDSKSLDEMRAMWRNWLPEFRVLCLSASQEKAAMWYHYADKYRGVVIELRTGGDSPWKLAEPVRYPADVPEIFTADGWGRLLTLKHELAVKKLLREYAIYKTPDWAYEEEWRVTAFKRPYDDGLFSDWRAAPTDFAKVLLGPHMRDGDRLEILALLDTDLSHVEVFQTRLELNRRFSFEPLLLPTLTRGA